MEGTVATARCHSLVLSPAGNVYTFGNNNSTPEIIEGLPLIASISMGSTFSLFVDHEGIVWGLGKLPGATCVYSPFKMKLEAKFQNLKIQMATVGRSDFYVLLDTEGGVWGYGYNFSGHFGLGHYNYTRILTKIENIPKISSLAAGKNHIILLDEHGNIWTCGENKHGQLGRRILGSASTNFAQLDLPVKYQAVAAGNSHSIALDIEGKPWNTKENPKQGPFHQEWESDIRIKFITTSSTNSWLIDEAGGLWYADGKSSLSAAIKVPNISNASFIAQWERHHIVVDSLGQVWVWGLNDYGQLGLDETTVVSPVINTLLPSLESYSQVKSARNI